jgi:homocitrate synthase NifV
VAALELLYDIDTGIDLSALTDLSQRFAGASGRPLHPNKPITGPAVFAHTLPTHVAAIRADSRSIQPFEPDLVGNVQRTGERPEG